MIRNNPRRLQQPPRALLRRISTPSVDINISPALRLSSLKFPLRTLDFHRIILSTGSLLVLWTRDNTPDLKGININLDPCRKLIRRSRRIRQENTLMPDRLGVELRRFKIHVYE